MQSRINTVYIGAKDKKNGCVGSICNLLKENTTATTNYEYLEYDECSSILTNFFKELRNKKRNSV